MYDAKEILATTVIFALPIFAVQMGFYVHNNKEFNETKREINQKAEQRANAGTMMVILLKDGRIAHAGIANGYKETLTQGSYGAVKYESINPDGLYQDKNFTQYRDIVTGVKVTHYTDSIIIIEGNDLKFTKEMLPELGTTFSDATRPEGSGRGSKTAPPAP